MKQVTMPMINAAKLAQAADKSDPHTYSRVMCHLRNGLTDIAAVNSDACSRLGINNSPDAIKQYLARL